MFKYTFFIYISLLFCITACTPAPQSKSFEMIPVYNGQELSCDKGFVVGEKNWRISYLALFVVNASFNGSDENNFSNKNQLELLGGGCSSSDNWLFNVYNASDEAATLEFYVGVPFSLNHNNPLTSEPPLNDSTMFWSWQLGHKFLRLDLESQTDSWSFHLGSMGCDSVAPVRSPSTPCKQPNLAKVTLTNVVGNKVYFHLDALVDGIELSRDSSCMSSLSTASCQLLLSRLGLIEDQQSLFSTSIKR